MVDLVLPVDAQVEGERLVEVELRSRVEPDHLVSGDGELHDLGDGVVGFGAGCEHPS